MEARHIEWNRPFSERYIMHISFYVWSLIKKKQRRNGDYEDVEDEHCRTTRTIYAVLYVVCPAKERVKKSERRRWENTRVRGKHDQTPYI